MATDWTKLRLEYIHGNMTLRELADTHGIKSAGVMRRAANEGWDASRKQESAKVSKVANEVLTDTRATELSKFNDDDLRVARAIRGKAATMLNNAQSAQEISSLARAFDIAQKIGRLALGAATENTNVSTRTLDPLKDEDFLG
jgi:uncharacterized protein YjcR